MVLFVDLNAGKRRQLFLFEQAQMSCQKERCSTLRLFYGSNLSEPIDSIIILFFFIHVLQTDIDKALYNNVSVKFILIFRCRNNVLYFDMYKKEGVRIVYRWNGQQPIPIRQTLLFCSLGKNVRRFGFRLRPFVHCYCGI